MSSKESVVDTMISSYIAYTTNGNTSAAGVNAIITAMMKAHPRDRADIMSSFEERARSLPSA